MNSGPRTRRARLLMPLAALLLWPLTPGQAFTDEAAGVRLRPVATTKGLGDYGFFSLKEIGGRLFAGTYCGGAAQGRCNVFISAPDGPRLRDTGHEIAAGESIYIFAEFKGRIYANTENRGVVFRSADGLQWEDVFHEHGLKGGSGRMGSGLAEYDGRLYASVTQLSPYAARIFSSSSGDPGSWRAEDTFGTKEGIQVRELIVYDGRLLALGYDHDKGRGASFALENGKGWSPHFFGGEKDHGKILGGQRIIKAHVWKGTLWMSTSPLKGNDRVPPAGVCKWDGKTLEQVYADPDGAVGTDIADYRGALYFIDMVNWNARKGNAGLHRSPTGEKGTWERIAVFPQPEAMDLEVHDGRLYAATRQTGGVGFVYRIDTAPPAPGEIGEEP